MPRQWPLSIGPPVTTIVGMFAEHAPRIDAGFVLSQPVSSTTPSSGIGADRLLDVHRHQVAVEHRRRLHQRLAERHDRELAREAAGLQHAALDRLGQPAQVHVAVDELRPASCRCRSPAGRETCRRRRRWTSATSGAGTRRGRTDRSRLVPVAAASVHVLVLEDDLGDDPAPVVHERAPPPRSRRSGSGASRSGRGRGRHRRPARRRATRSMPGRRCCRSGSCPCRRTGRRGGSACVPRRRSRAGRPGRPGRQSCVASSTADGHARGLDDEVELGLRRRAVAREDDLGGAEPAARARAPPRARRRRRSATASAARSSAIASAPSVPTPITPTASPGLRARLLEAAQDDRGGLDEHAGVEGDVLGQAVHDLLGHRDELGVATRPREPERLDALAPVRLAAAAAPAAMADDQALADDAVARRARIRRPPRPRRRCPPTRGRG